MGLESPSLVSLKNNSLSMKLTGGKKRRRLSVGSEFERTARTRFIEVTALGKNRDVFLILNIVVDVTPRREETCFAQNLSHGRTNDRFSLTKKFRPENNNKNENEN